MEHFIYDRSSRSSGRIEDTFYIGRFTTRVANAPTTYLETYSLAVLLSAIPDEVWEAAKRPASDARVVETFGGTFSVYNDRRNRVMAGQSDLTTIEGRNEVREHYESATEDQLTAVFDAHGPEYEIPPPPTGRRSASIIVEIPNVMPYESPVPAEPGATTRIVSWDEGVFPLPPAPVDPLEEYRRLQSTWRELAGLVESAPEYLDLQNFGGEPSLGNPNQPSNNPEPDFVVLPSVRSLLNENNQGTTTAE